MDSHDEHRILVGGSGTEHVRGWLESPSSTSIAHDCLIVSGWAFASSPILEIRATGVGPAQILRCGQRRDDVARVYPHESNALHSGFSGYLEHASLHADRIHLEIWATLADGRSIRLFERRLTPGGEDSPLHVAFEAVRQRPRLLFSIDAWRRGLNALSMPGPKESPGPTTFAPTPQGYVAATVVEKDPAYISARTFLKSFLASGSELQLPTPPSPSSAPLPIVSIVLVLWNRADLTLACLRSLCAQTGVPFEVIVVDNASTDETSDLLERVRGVTVVRHAENVGFTAGANTGARAASGTYLLFLNNDTELLPGSLAQLVESATRSARVGAVGGKLVFPDGRLQEAGAMIWSDGSCAAYGRGSDPHSAEFSFERPVDFCSGALLLTPRTLFNALDGFDERYRPAYYEDVDYCVRLWTGGYSVIYQPKAGAVHHEFASASSREASIELQRTRRAIFVERHREWLRSQSSPDPRASTRSHPHDRSSALVVDDAVPDPRNGAGFPRAAVLLDALSELGFEVTLYTTGAERMGRLNGRFSGVEIIEGGVQHLRSFLTGRQRQNVIIVSRPHNLQYVKAAIGADLKALGAPCVYDAEAVFALREVGRRALLQQPLSSEERESLVTAELSLTRGCASVLTVSDDERALFASGGMAKVFRLGHAVVPQASSNGVPRLSLLFVGAFNPDSPNEDAIRYLCTEILPALQGTAAGSAPLVVAGARIPEHVRSVRTQGVSWHSDVDDLAPFYAGARVFVAPTRYGAGIPLKLLEAAAFGVPIVCTPLVARQLGWESGNELLVAEDPEQFAREIASLYVDQDRWKSVRERALARVSKDYSPDAFRAALRSALAGSGVL